MTGHNSSVLATFLGGEWVSGGQGAVLPVTDPATGQVLASVPLSQPDHVARVVQSAAAAFPAWRQVPPGDLIQYLFRFKALLEAHLN